MSPGADEGPDAAHTNLVIGRKGGPVETAWASALATPTVGHAPFVAVLRPNVPVKPLTLFVSKAEPSGELHQNAIWGSAQDRLRLRRTSISCSPRISTTKPTHSMNSMYPIR